MVFVKNTKLRNHLCLTIALGILFAFTPNTLVDAKEEPKTVLKFSIENPFCSIPTFAQQDLVGSARSRLNSNQDPEILIDSELLSKKNLSRFLMAHECCHHQLGHVRKLKAAKSATGTRLVMSRRIGITWVQQIELNADCCAANLLFKHGEDESLSAAKAFMSNYGMKPTGKHYPRGLERVAVITQCASPDVQLGPKSPRKK